MGEPQELVVENVTEVAERLRATLAPYTDLADWSDEMVGAATAAMIATEDRLASVTRERDEAQSRIEVLERMAAEFLVAAGQGRASEGAARARLRRLAAVVAERDALREAVTLPDGRYEQVCKLGHHTVAADLLDECPWPLGGLENSPCKADMESVIVWHHKLVAALAPTESEGRQEGQPDA